MATIVESEVVITKDNQADDGYGRHFITNACPDLLALTLKSGDARMLPIGWKIQLLVDSKTGNDKGMLFKAPDGRVWDMSKCATGTTESPSGWWTWLPLVGLGAFFLWVYTKKGK